MEIEELREKFVFEKYIKEENGCYSFQNLKEWLEEIFKAEVEYLNKYGSVQTELDIEIGEYCKHYYVFYYDFDYDYDDTEYGYIGFKEVLEFYNKDGRKINDSIGYHRIIETTDLGDVDDDERLEYLINSFKTGNFDEYGLFDTSADRCEADATEMAVIYAGYAILDYNKALEEDLEENLEFIYEPFQEEDYSGLKMDIEIKGEINYYNRF